MDESKREDYAPPYEKPSFEVANIEIENGFANSYWEDIDPWQEQNL